MTALLTTCEIHVAYIVEQNFKTRFCPVYATVIVDL